MFQSYSGVKLGSMLDQKLKLCVHQVSIKIQFFQNAWNYIFTTMRNTRAQNFYSIWRCLPWSYCPQTPPKMDSIVSWTNSEYLKAETLYPESIDGLDGPIVGYLRIYDDSWFVSREQFRPNFGSKNVFAVIFLEPGNFDIWYS